MCWPWGQVAAEDCLDGQQSGRDGVICVSLCLSVHPFTFLPIHPSIHHLFISPPINLPFIHPTIQSPTIHLTHSSIVLCASTRYLLPPQTQSASLRCCHLIHPSIHPSIYPSTHASIHSYIHLLFAEHLPCTFSYFSTHSLSKMWGLLIAPSWVGGVCLGPSHPVGWPLPDRVPSHHDFRSRSSPPRRRKELTGHLTCAGLAAPVFSVSGH